MIKGYANKKANIEYFNRLNIKKEKLRATEDFLTLPIALGTHLGNFSDEDSSLYKEAITHALENGINFIDTAVNYRGMRSERDIAAVIDYLINEKKTLNREEIVISTKAGIIPGDIVLGIYPKDYLKTILIEGGILSEADINVAPCCKHTLAPAYYEYAINLSREHIGVDTIDIHYIHNPEHSKETMTEEDFYQKLEVLFTFYEGQVAAGKIRNYGLATWDSLITDSSAKEYISLEKAMTIAKKIAGEHHHFRYIQLPFNLSNTAAKANQNQPVGDKMLSAIDAAKALGLNVTISAPLSQGNLISSTTPVAALDYVTTTEGVYAAMVGMKRVENVKSNLALFI